MNGWRRSVGALAAVAGLLGLLTGCGLPEDAKARPVASGDLPPGLLGPTTTTIEAPTASAAFRGTVYFLDEDATHLVPVKVALADGASTTLVKAVIAGPDPDARPPLGSDIPPDTELVDLTQKGRLLTVVLSGDIIKVTGGAQANAFAQLVWTATELKGIDEVTFLVIDADGKRQPVKPPTDSGSEQTIIDRNDYLKISPPRTTTTTAPAASGATPPPAS
jgi:hypothetical protein